MMTKLSVCLSTTSYNAIARTEVKLQAFQSSIADQGMLSISHFSLCIPDTQWIGTSEDTMTGLEIVAKIKIPTSTESPASHRHFTE